MAAQPRRQLSLFDSTCIIVGIVVGVGIYVTAPDTAAATSTPAAMLALWLIGGLVSLAGAMCYAELASAWPREGGEYIYLSHAYGRWAGFLFAWAKILIIMPADVALMAFAFAEYGSRVLPVPPQHSLWLAVGCVATLTMVNALGVRFGKWTQNLLTVIKTLGLLAILGVGMMAPPLESSASTHPAPQGSLMLAMILVMFTYGGWSEMGYVAAEVRDPHRNIARALILGVAAVTGLYLLVNFAFLHVLGQSRVAASDAVAVQTVAAVAPQYAANFVGALICISALGAANGLLFTGSRVAYALGADYPAMGALGRWSGAAGSPVRAILFQGTLSLAVVLLGRKFADTVIYSSPVIWLSYTAAAAGVIVLRLRRPEVERPFRVPFYPVTVPVFCAFGGLMIYGGVRYAWEKSLPGPLVSGAVLAVGAIVYSVARFHRRDAD